MSKPLVIYDGTCGLCAGNLKWLRRLDWLKRFDDAPYQAEDIKRRVPQVSAEQFAQALYVAFPDGRLFSGADAFREIFLRLPATLPLGLALSLPPLGWLARRLYPVIARNRYLLGGRCEVRKP